MMNYYCSLFIFFNLVLFCYSEGLQCKKCKSSKDQACAQNPEKIKEIPCENDENRCIVRIDNQETIRSCGKVGSCEKDPKNCKECKTPDECGTIYPENRQKCIQCEVKDCEKDEDLSKSLPCVNYVEKDTCYSIVKNDKSTYRGCLSDKTSEICTDNEKICKKCTDKDCNKDSGKATVKCYKCDKKDCQRGSKTGTECKLDDNYIKDCETLYNRESCYTLRDRNDVTRGCVSELPLSTSGLLEKCPPNGDGEKVKCNSKCIEDVQCPQCDSKTDPTNCGKEDYKITKCPEYTSTCFWCEDNDGNTYRGCGNGNKSHTCNYGYGEPAKKPKSACYACDKSNKNCVTLEEPVESKQCTKTDDQCVVQIADGYTVRGCATDVLGEKINECKEERLCKLCKGNNCNSSIYPVNRRLCYQCTKCNDVQSKNIKSKPCFMYDRNENCYTYANGEDMYRGCKSDKNEECTKAGEKCAYCDSNDCNDSGAVRDAKLKCAKCDKDELECIWAQNITLAAKCSEKVKYWEKETCFTYFHNATVVSRGCSLENPLCKGTDENCKKCDNENCNTKNMIPFTCLRCRSDDVKEGSCKDTLKGIEKLQCDKNYDMQFENRGCYTRRQDDVIIRGCLIDLSPELREKCLDKDYKYCDSCKDMNCNGKTPPNSATNIKLSFILIGFAIIIAKVK